MTQDEIQAVALKPCPFCRSSNLIVEHMDGTILHPAHRVRCDDCGACSRYTDRDFIAAWNTRADAAPTPKADEIEAVARAMCLEGGFNPDEIMPNDGPRWCYYVGGAQAAISALAAIAALDAARGDSHNDVLSSCQPYLKQGETPAECIKRNHDDSIALMELLTAERIKVSNYEKTMAAIGEIENGEARRRRLETASEAQLIDYINELESKLCAALDAARGDPVARVVEWLRKENGLCDCHARCETECGCGAWDDWKTKPLLEIADAIERGEPFNG